MRSTGRPESWERRARKVQKKTTSSVWSAWPGRKLEIRTLDSGELEIGPDNQSFSSLAPSAQLQTGPHADDFQHVQRETVVFAAAGGARGLAQDAGAVVVLADVKVDAKVGVSIERSSWSVASHTGPQETHNSTSFSKPCSWSMRLAPGRCSPRHVELDSLLSVSHYQSASLPFAVIRNQRRRMLV